MKINVTIESPVSHRPPRARFGTTDRVVETIQVELDEISASDAVPALFAEITPDPRREPEDRQILALFGHFNGLPAISNDIELKGYGGALWLDAARDSRERYVDFAANRIRGKDEGEIASFVSPDGASLPPGGLLHWLDEYAAHQLYRNRLIVLSADQPVPMPGNDLRGIPESTNMIRDERDLNRAEMDDYVRKNFLMIDGRLHSRTAPPGFWVASAGRDIEVGLERKAAPSPGRVWFSLTETEAFEEFSSDLQGKRNRLDRCLGQVEVHHADSDLLALDKVHLGYAALQHGLALCGSAFGDLPDDALLCWIKLRRISRRWTAADGHAQELFEDMERMQGLIPREAKSANETFDRLTAALMLQSKSLDLRERIAPEDDPELAGLQL